MKKIILINANNEHKPYPVPPIGLFLVASSVKEKYKIKIVDGVFLTTKEILTETVNFKPDYIGISIRNIDNLQIIDSKCYFDHIQNNIVNPIKEISTSPIILGGSGFSIFAEHLINKLNVDYGVIGEGEKVFPELLQYLDKNKDPSKLPGVITKSNKGFIKNNNFLNINKLPFTEFDKYINYDFYKDRGAYSIQTKRGCYHKCIYCTYTYLEGNNYRLRSPIDVADEIEEANKRLGYLIFEFVDSTFNDPPGHAEEICKEIIKRKINIGLRTMGINPANASEELFNLMMKAGFTQIDCTPDSASPKMIKNLKKNFTLDQLKRTAEIIKKNDIPTMWFFIFGGPEESVKTIRESFDFIDNYIYELDMVHITKGLRIYPKTELYDIAIKDKIITKDNDLIFPLFYISKNFTLENLNKIIYEETSKRPNCIPAEESTPSKLMLESALKFKDKLKLNKPMFRILLKLRQEMYKENKQINLI